MKKGLYVFVMLIIGVVCLSNNINAGYTKLEAFNRHKNVSNEIDTTDTSVTYQNVGMSNVRLIPLYPDPAFWNICLNQEWLPADNLILFVFLDNMGLYNSGKKFNVLFAVYNTENDSWEKINVISDDKYFIIRDIVINANAIEFTKRYESDKDGIKSNVVIDAVKIFNSKNAKKMGKDKFFAGANMPSERNKKNEKISRRFDEKDGRKHSYLVLKTKKNNIETETKILNYGENPKFVPGTEKIMFRAKKNGEYICGFVDLNNKAKIQILDKADLNLRYKDELNKKRKLNKPVREIDLRQIVSFSPDRKRILFESGEISSAPRYGIIELKDGM